MRLPIFVGIFALLLIAKGAFAACAGTQVTDSTNPTLSNLLSGNTVCVSGCTETINVGGTPTVVNIWCWQEQHQGTGGGTLSDYKKGSDPVDPTKVLGTWGVSGTGADTVVTYNYTTFTPNATEVFTVWDNGNGTYNFCAFSAGTDDVEIATIHSGIGSCP